MALPTAQMESSYRELFSLVVLRHLDPVPKLPVLAMAESRHIGLVEDGAIYTHPHIQPDVLVVMC